MNIPLPLLLDLSIAVLLIVTIGFALTLNNRLSVLRKDKEELEKLALNFGDATTRAEKSIGELGASLNVLQERIKRAESLREDLVFLVERGNGTADSLEGLLRTARDQVGVMPGQLERNTAKETETQKAGSENMDPSLKTSNSSNTANEG